MSQPSTPHLNAGKQSPASNGLNEILKIRVSPVDADGRMENFQRAITLIAFIF
jgi:hypothetical protein